MACLNSSHGGLLPGADHSQRSMLAVQIESPELEWYYPLLKPYVHYIPMVANESWVNLEEVIGMGRKPSTGGCQDCGQRHSLCNQIPQRSGEVSLYGTFSRC